MADRYRLRPGSPDVHGRPLDRPDGTRTPLFDGDPARDQVQQGGLGDCGVITKRPDQPGFASSGDAGVAWPSIREKALAGVDRTWTNDRRTDWEKRWPRQCEHEDRLPHGLIAAHAYEVVAVGDDNKIHLRNPWDYAHPEPMAAAQFRESVSPGHTTLEKR